MKLAMIAREFPPSHGGMPVLAASIARELHHLCELVVFTKQGNCDPSAEYEQRPVLSGEIGHDLAVIRELQPDAWLAMNAGYTPLASMLDQPVFCYYHGNDFLRPTVGKLRRWVNLVRRVKAFRPYRPYLQSWLRRRDIAASIQDLAGVLTNSTNTAALIEARYGRSAVVCPPGVGDEFFRTDRPDPADRLNVMTVARLRHGNRRKNVDGVLQALKLLENEISFHYTVIGDGEEREYFRDLSVRLGIGDCCEFPGNVDLEELIQAYLRTDLFILASRKSKLDVEGFGLVYLEANATGTPVICSREGGAVDAVSHGVNGLVIDKSDPESIAAGIRSFAESRAEFEPDKVRAFADGFRWQHAAGRIMDAIRTSIPNVSSVSS